VIQAEKDDGRIHQHTTDCRDVGELVAGKFYGSVRGETKGKDNSIPQKSIIQCVPTMLLVAVLCVLMRTNWSHTKHTKQHTVRSTETSRKFSTTHLSFLKCKLNAKNIIDRMMPTIASDVTVKNANFDIVAMRTLKTRFAIGTWPFVNLIVMQ